LLCGVVLILTILIRQGFWRIILLTKVAANGIDVSLGSVHEALANQFRKGMLSEVVEDFESVSHDVEDADERHNDGNKESETPEMGPAFIGSLTLTSISSPSVVSETPENS
jgi:hypothetical protein